VEKLETENTQTQETTETNEVVIDDAKAVLAALDRAKQDAKRFREEKEKLEIDLNSKDLKIAEFSGKLLDEKIMQKLSAEGIKEPRRVLKFLNMTTLQFDENLEVVGFEDQFNQLKEDLPELFDAKVRVGGQADTAVSTTVNTRISATEMQARKILGRI
jgi:hypothetical protein